MPLGPQSSWSLKGCSKRHALLQEKLGEPNRCEALAVDARQELDLKCGVAFTRFQTRFFQVIPFS